MTLHLRETPAPVEIARLLDSTLNSSSPRNAYASALKRALDITLVLISAPMVLLIVAILATTISFGGGAPFYCQQRVGRNGRMFRMWKLRSMVADADAMLERHLAADPAARAEWDRSQKLRNDPRITRFGRFIRKTSLDELPQLWNVLVGDMSLVGPRPMMPSQQAIYPGSAYYALRPGITGFWQTSVRNESSFAERAAFDSLYLRKLSFRTDLTILLRTVSVVVKSTGC